MRNSCYLPEPSNEGMQKIVDVLKNQLEGEQLVRGQEHFYLEGQVSVASPNEDGGVHVISSSQHPTEVQKLVASALGVGINRVDAEVRRMGGDLAVRSLRLPQ